MVCQLGSGDITNMWKYYFENHDSTKIDSKYRYIFESKLSNRSADTSDVLFTVHDAISATNKQTFPKAAGCWSRWSTDGSFYS